jgi:hypothetical protein
VGVHEVDAEATSKAPHRSRKDPRLEAAHAIQALDAS